MVLEVISHLKDDNFVACSEIDENRFLVETPLTELRHRTYMTFAVTGDVLRLEFKHILGTLDVANHREFEDMASILLDNNGAFHMSSAYIAVELIDRVPYVSLQTYRTFLTKWTPEDIADQIKLAFYDLKMAIIYKDAGNLAKWPLAIRMFG